MGGGITPKGTLSITSNGNYDVKKYANANVSVGVKSQSKTQTFTIYGNTGQTVTFYFENLSQVVGVSSVTNNSPWSATAIPNAISVSGNTVNVYVINGRVESVSISLSVTAVGY